MLRRILLVLFLISSCACQRANEREAHRNQSDLAEAEMLMMGREFEDAATVAKKAINALAVLLEKDPKNLDVRLLQIRAYLTVFLAENALLIENSPPQAQSLVQIPRRNEYINYDTYVQPALADLMELARADTDYSFEQGVFIHGNLAAIFRLDARTASEAASEYDKTLAIYDAWLQDLQQPKSKLGSKKYAIQKTKYQIRSMRMARAEVNLLAKQWEEALASLESAVGGKDLKFFTVHFQSLEQRKVILEAKIVQEEMANPHSKEKRLLMLVKDRAAKRNKMREQVAAYSPYQAELIFTRGELADLQNNLSYRIICYHWLNMPDERDAVRKTLRTFYPDLEAEVASALKI